MYFASTSPPTDPPTASPTDPPLIPDGHYLDFSRTGIPWVDRALDIATVGALVLVVICAVGFIAWVRWVKPALTQLQATAEKAATDAAVTREHTENSHASAENPNLRDDLDAKFKGVTDALGKLDTGQVHLATMLARVEDAQRRQDRELSRIQEAQAADRADTRRVREALDEHISDKRDFAPRLAEVERELKTHRKKTETP